MSKCPCGGAVTFVAHPNGSVYPQPCGWQCTECGFSWGVKE